MSSGADLFVVCKHCGAEVSPYITECPYCGSRLRRRAPKLPRVNGPSPPEPSRRPRRRLGRTSPTPRRTRGRSSSGRWSTSRPYVTIALVIAGCAGWVVPHAYPSVSAHMFIIGPLGGEWWKLIVSQFAYADGVYAFVAIAATAIFGTLIERRHGPLMVLALFLGAGAVGSLAALAAYPFPFASGANAGALALLAAWAAPDLLAARAGSEHDGDLLGAGAIAALLLAVPFALPRVSWLAGVVGALIGLIAGAGLGGAGDV